MLATLASPSNEPDLVQHAQMLDHGLTTDWEISGESGRGGFTSKGELLEEDSPCGVGQRGEYLGDVAHGESTRGVSALAMTYLANSLITCGQPPEWSSNSELNERPTGKASVSKPLSNTRSTVPFGVDFRVNSTRVEFSSVARTPGCSTAQWKEKTLQNHALTDADSVNAAHTRSIGASMSTSRSIESVFIE